MHKALKIIEQFRRIHGLDHADGIAERQLAINEQMANQVIAMVQAIFGDERVGLTEEQRQAAVPVLGEQLDAIDAKELGDDALV